VFLLPVNKMMRRKRPLPKSNSSSNDNSGVTILNLNNGAVEKKVKKTQSGGQRIFILFLLFVTAFVLHVIRYNISIIDGKNEIDTEIDTKEVDTKEVYLRAPSFDQRGIETDIVFSHFNFKYGNDEIWDVMLEEAEALKTERGDPMHVMEVGMHRPKQCIEAAQKGLWAYCVEPSPNSVGRIISGIERQPEDTKKYIRFYQMAAGSSTGLSLPFISDGGTGDRIALNQETGGVEDGNKVIVKSVALDDIVNNNKVTPTNDYTDKTESSAIDRIFLMKVDTQGFEPHVFSGLTKSLPEHKIDFIFMEFWPKGIDNMMMMSNDEDFHKPCLKEEPYMCIESVKLLQVFLDAGYKIYGLRNVSHPNAPKTASRFINDFSNPNHDHNYGNVMDFCKWYYDLEIRHTDENYWMGYWTDLLIVSPVARLPENPVSAVGKKLSEILNTNSP